MSPYVRVQLLGFAFQLILARNRHTEAGGPA